MALDGDIKPTVKPDADNVEKAVKDALNGVVWVDDCQVVNCEKEKFYSTKPGVHAVIETVRAHPAQITRKPVSKAQIDLAGFVECV